MTSSLDSRTGPPRLLGHVAGYIVLALLLPGCGPDHSAPGSAATGSTRSPNEANNVVSRPRLRDVLGKPTLRDVVEYALPQMDDDEPFNGPKAGDPRAGWKLVRDWSQAHMSWEIVKDGTAVKVGPLWNHPSFYRGDVVCATGSALPRRNPIEEPNVFLDSGEGHFIKVWLVGPDEAPSEGTALKACGVFVGAFSEAQDSVNGIVIVGLLNTEAGRSWVPPQALPLGNPSLSPWSRPNSTSSDILR